MFATVAGVLLTVFLLAPVLAGMGRSTGVTGRTPMDVNPLVGVATVLATGVLYARLWLGVVTLLSTLLFGRVFCSWVRPTGIVQDIFGVGPQGHRLRRCCSIGCGICEQHCPVAGKAAILVSSVGESPSPSNRMLPKR